MNAYNAFNNFLAETQRNDIECKCPLQDPQSSSAATTTAASPSLEDIAELQEVMEKVCRRIRGRLEKSATRVGNTIYNLQDDCSVTLTYEFSSTAQLRWQSHYRYPQGSLRATAGMSGKFEKGGATRQWSLTPKNYRQEVFNQKLYNYREDMKTAVEGFERKIDISF